MIRAYQCHCAAGHMGKSLHDVEIGAFRDASTRGDMAAVARLLGDPDFTMAPVILSIAAESPNPAVVERVRTIYAERGVDLWADVRTATLRGDHRVLQWWYDAIGVGNQCTAAHRALLAACVSTLCMLERRLGNVLKAVFPGVHAARATRIARLRASIALLRVRDVA